MIFAMSRLTSILTVLGICLLVIIASGNIWLGASRSVSKSGLSVQNVSLQSDFNDNLQSMTFESVSEAEGILHLEGRAQPEENLWILNDNIVVSSLKSDALGYWKASIKVQKNEIMVFSLRMVLEDDLVINSSDILFHVPLPLKSYRHSPPPSLLLLTRAGKNSHLWRSPFDETLADGILRFSTLEYDDLGGAIFSGTSQMPGRVRIYADGKAIGDTQVKGNGTWTYMRTDSFSIGRHEIGVELNVDGEVRARLQTAFERLSPQSALSADEVFVRFEPLNWQLRRGLAGGGVQYSVIFAPNVEAALPVPEQVGKLDL